VSDEPGDIGKLLQQIAHDFPGKLGDSSWTSVFARW